MKVFWNKYNNCTGFKNYSEGGPQYGEVHPYTEYAIDETAGPYTSEDIRYVMEVKINLSNDLKHYVIKTNSKREKII